MSNVSRLWSAASVFFCLVTSVSGIAAHAQALPETPLQRQLDRIDLGVAAIGQITKDVSGKNYLNESITQRASTTVGVLVTLRYTKSPFMGFEGNFSQARYTENFSGHVIGGAQTKASEYSLGYVAHLPNPLGFGVRPFGSAGVGTIAFRPTSGGGQGLPSQYRMGYYYNVGLDDDILSKHFGLRLSLRQVFYKAPDFGQNYLTIQQHTNTLEPSIGFYLKF
jgi:opacity protein-like surface antigen